MTEKELKRLSRSELLQMLITQAEENKALKDRLEETETQLKDRQITIEKSGSLAEVALSLNGVFQATDAAAKQYLENVKRMSNQQEAACRALQADAEKKAEEIMQNAQAYSQKLRAEADDYWKQVVAKTQTLLEELDAQRKLIRSAGTGQGQ